MPYSIEVAVRIHDHMSFWSMHRLQKLGPLSCHKDPCALFSLYDCPIAYEYVLSIKTQYRDRQIIPPKHLWAATSTDLTYSRREEALIATSACIHLVSKGVIINTLSVNSCSYIGYHV